VTFAPIRRRGRLHVVLEAMQAAETASISPVKVNVALLRGQNDDEILEFAAVARETGRIVRSLEFMPLDAEVWRAFDSAVRSKRPLSHLRA
jgi:cyclic pyranopterin phosphate synthase